MADLVNAIGDLEIAFLGKHHDPGLGREVVQVTVAPGDGNAGTAGHYARAHQITFIDRVAQIHRQKRIRAHVAHRGKTGFQRLARIEDGGKGVVEGRVLEVVDFVVPVGARTKYGCGNRLTQEAPLPARGR